MRYFGITLLILLSACKQASLIHEEAFDQEVIKHELVLRQHFMGTPYDTDISTLIKHTKQIANQLRARKRFSDANRFDSYTDVLLYGNNTIDESLNDVRKLVDNPNIPYQNARCIGPIDYIIQKMCNN